MAGICTSSSPYPIEKVGDSPYPYPYPVNAGTGSGNTHYDTPFIFPFSSHFHIHKTPHKLNILLSSLISLTFSNRRT